MPRTRSTVAYEARLGTIRAAIAAYLRRAWTDLPDYRQADIDAFARSAAPVVAGGQRQVASLTDQHLAVVEAETTGEPVRPVGVPAAVISPKALRGVEGVELYGRPGVAVWTALSKGRSFEEAVGLGLILLLTIGETDLQLAMTHASRYLFEQRDGIVGYRRVPEPDACELCNAGDDIVFATDQLMPIHDRCACGVEPVFGERAIDGADSETERDGFEVHEHGELGPVLRAEGDEFATLGS